MKPLTIRLLNNDITDLYCYAGVGFFTTDEGDVYSISLSTICDELSKKYSEYSNFFKIALINNDYLLNDQFKTLVFGKIYKKFIFEWDKASKIIFEYSLDLSTCENLGRVSGYPIYDIKAYGFHLFVGHGKGVDYFKLNTKNAGQNTTKSKKMIDARIVSISAKIGQILYSAGTNGLFTNSLIDENLTINETPLFNTSFKTIWSTWDFANYESNNKFVYFHNKTTKQEKRKYSYSNLDDEKTKNVISEIGFMKINSSELLKEKEIDYIINNNKYYYMILKNGDIKLVNLIKDDDGGIHLSSRQKLIFQNNKEKIISAKSGYESLVIESFDNLSLLKDNKISILNNTQPLNYRTYLTSIRLRKTITASYVGYSDLYLTL